jgi:hypothetical protein
MVSAPLTRPGPLVRASARTLVRGRARRAVLTLFCSGLWHLLANDYAAAYLDASFLAAISARCRSVGRVRDIRRAVGWSRCHNRFKSIGLDH